MIIGKKKKVQQTEEDDGRIVDELQGNGKALALAARQAARRNVRTRCQAERRHCLSERRNADIIIIIVDDDDYNDDDDDDDY